MPRKSRDFYLSDFVHVMVQGDEKKFIYQSDAQKEKYVYLMYKYALANDVEIIAYCVMGNHAHLLLYSKEIEKISQMMKQTNTTYGIYYNKTRETVGHVFRDRFRCENIFSKNYLVNCIKYIHQNPVKARMCLRCEDYKYSSFKDFQQGLKEYSIERK